MSKEQDTVDLANSCTSSLPPAEIESIISLARAGEWGVALENLAVQLFEHDSQLTVEFADRFAAVATASGLHPKYTEFVRRLIKR